MGGLEVDDEVELDGLLNRQVAGLAALLLAPQRSSAEQSPGEIPRVGILTVADNDKSPMLDALREGLHDLG